MALDYSKLSDEELQAIAAGDYSRLSDATLQQLASETAPVAAAPNQSYVSQAEADRNEMLGLGALGAGAAGAGALAYKFAPQAIDLAKKYSPTGRLASKVIDVAKTAMATPAQAAPAVSPILDAQGRPMTRPVAPAPAPAPAAPPQQPSVMDKASQIVRQLAANRAVQGAAKFGGALAVGLGTPGNVGQDYPFPQSGPLRGSEINPNTGRPWTKEELAAYRAQYGR